MDALKESEAWDDTLFIYTTDHGLPFPGMKCSLFDSGMGVSLIVRTPQTDRRG
ncbi:MULTISPECIES: hypothetical protein [unclassified Paenibacillus]|uniref:hypothetical protein n=1 Tax=unclassified Paenibacillus TaxID=185978 RepID=UPI003631411C